LDGAVSRVVLAGEMQGEWPFNGATVEVVARSGCDLNPVDPTTEDGRLTLLSFTWPDLHARLAQLAAAIEMAKTVPAKVERAEATEWLARQLTEPRPGTATIVFHSIVLVYMSPEARSRFEETLAEAGARATQDAPLAWVSMERGPGGERRLISRAGFHGAQVTLIS